MSDSTDANINPFSYFFRDRNAGQEEVISSKIQSCKRLADYYNDSHKRRGVALIFNHEFFDDKTYKPREGTQKDEAYLQYILSELEFDVRIYRDLKYGAIFDVLRNVSLENHSNADCLLVCVMSHGEDGKINAKDHGYPPDHLWAPFAGDKCQTLAGKPKLFFIQACRGSEVDDGTKVRNRIQTDSRSDDEVYTIPAMADILVMYSTYQGYFSWRSPDKGSWFIQALCQEFQENVNRCDLMTMLTFVNRRVSTFYRSNVPNDKSMHGKKQVCTIVSTLTRLMIFRSKKLTAPDTKNKEEDDAQVPVDRATDKK